ncbi:MAG: MraZ protein [Kiritimatiellia bacterium]|jgi:MraZ protein
MGTHKNSLDGKKRLTVPSKWREQMGAGQTLYVMPDMDVDCLRVYPKAGLNLKVSKLRNASMGDEEAQMLARIFGGESQDAEWDNQGRVRITDFLLEYAGLKKEVLIVGALTHFELWEPAAYMAYMKQHRSKLKEAIRNHM